MKIIKPVKNRWIAPLIIIFSGIINLSIEGLSETLKLGWYIVLPFALFLTIIGVINHFKFKAESDKNVK